MDSPTTECNQSNGMHCSVCGSPSVTVTQEMVKPLTTISYKATMVVLSVIVFFLAGMVLKFVGLPTTIMGIASIIIAIVFYCVKTDPKAQEVTVVRCSNCGKAHVTTPLPQNAKEWKLSDQIL